MRFLVLPLNDKRGGTMRKPNGGQSIVEYILFLTAVVVVLLAFIGTKGFFRDRVESTLNQSVDALDRMVRNVDVR